MQTLTTLCGIVILLGIADLASMNRKINLRIVGGAFFRLPYR